MSEVKMLVGNDALSKCIDFWLDGFTSGAGSILADQFGHLPEAERDEFVHTYVRTLKADPLAMEAVANEVRERLVGIDSGPKDFSVNFDGSAP